MWTVNGNLRGNLYTQRVMDVSNKLPEEVVEASTVIMFKNHLDQHMERVGFVGYGSKEKTAKVNYPLAEDSFFILVLNGRSFIL